MGNLKLLGTGLMKNSLFFYVCLILLISCNKSRKDYQYLNSLFKNDSLLNTYNKIIVVSKIQCPGCVEDKLKSLINITNLEERKKYLFVLDTNDNIAYSLIKPTFTFLVRKQEDIALYDKDKYVSNYVMFYRGENNYITSKTFYITSDTTSIFYFFNSVR